MQETSFRSFQSTAMTANVRLAFTPNEVAVNAVRGSIASVDAATLLETTLFVGVRFQVDDVDVLMPRVPATLDEVIVSPDGDARLSLRAANDRGLWRELPIVGFASGLAWSIADLASSGVGSLDLAGGGTLRFRMIDQTNAQISTTESSATVYVEFDELCHAIAAFVSSVREWLEVDIPEIATLKQWQTWFPAHPCNLGHPTGL